MFTSARTSAEECQDAVVSKHQYHVHVHHTMGPTVMDEILWAGSRAHAALIVGMMLISQQAQLGRADHPSTIHNIVDHLVVNVELVD